MFRRPGRHNYPKQWRPLAIIIPVAIAVAVSYLFFSSSSSDSVTVLVFSSSVVETNNGVSVSVERVSIVPQHSINRPSSETSPTEEGSGDDGVPDVISDDRHALIEGRFFNNGDGPVLMRPVFGNDRLLPRGNIGEGGATITLPGEIPLDVEPDVRANRCETASGWFEILPGASVDYSIRLSVRLTSSDPARREELAPARNRDVAEDFAIDLIETGQLPAISFPPFVSVSCGFTGRVDASRIDIALTELGSVIEMAYYPFGPPECTQEDDFSAVEIWLPPGDSLARNIAISRGCLTPG